MSGGRAGSTVLTIGSCHGIGGQLAYGALDGLELPTGGVEALAVVIAQGFQRGPTLWLTANIHGNELAGIPVLHRFLSPELCKRLRGAVVALPSLNPAGLRTNRRNPYYDDRDPNRTFPGRRRPEGEPKEPSVYERLTARLLESLRQTADLYIDFHCAAIKSTPFSIRDRVLYRDALERPAAEALSARLDEMVEAFGFPAVSEFRAPAYVAKELHRSTTGAALQELGVPAFTVELGSHTVVDERAVNAAVVGLRNVLRWARMLDGAPEPMPPIPRPLDARRRRREDGPYANATGILDYRVEPGSLVPAGGVIAELRDLWGRKVGDGLVRTPTEGWVLSIEDGILAYPGMALAHLAVLDDEPLVAEWPAP